MRETSKKLFNNFTSTKLNKLLTLIILVTVLVFVNILSKNSVKYDMTFEKIFSLSDQTHKVLADLERKVNI